MWSLYFKAIFFGVFLLFKCNSEITQGSAKYDLIYIQFHSYAFTGKTKVQLKWSCIYWWMVCIYNWFTNIQSASFGRTLDSDHCMWLFKTLLPSYVAWDSITVYLENKFYHYIWTRSDHLDKTLRSLNSRMFIFLVFSACFCSWSIILTLHWESLLIFQE